MQAQFKIDLQQLECTSRFAEQSAPGVSDQSALAHDMGSGLHPPIAQPILNCAMGGTSHIYPSSLANSLTEDLLDRGQQVVDDTAAVGLDLG
ncbi:hypothetical protein, partial [Chitinivorax tropicus]|uniref:hypothetical protein n=1 Tax=Chitinivorax tropicus TaxID=714531 RepID=UPI001C84E21F